MRDLAVPRPGEASVDMAHRFALAFAVMIAVVGNGGATSWSRQPTWTADNGNGTFSNPLFYDEFSDPDIIRVGDDFYMTGTTMHSMPGLPVLHSRDLVNWRFLSYASEQLDLAPAFRLEGGESVYGQGHWAPSFRHHNGAFHIFSNVNGQTTQHYTARDPRGPWTHTRMRRNLHDLSVLFDDDGKVYVVWGYQEIRLAELDAGLGDVLPGTERVIIPKGAGMGEGLHFYKIDGRYFITSAEWDGMRMPAARAVSLKGPWEVNPAISVDEDFGLVKGYRAIGRQPPFEITAPDASVRGWGSLHQGGLVQTPAGEWWGFSMYDANSIGRLTALSPITWKDGWPYFGLPGNLTRTPRVWVKPATRTRVSPHAPYQRSDNFSVRELQPVWQWNHVPVKGKWSLTERPGFLRLRTMSAPHFLAARNTLTQRAIGPRSTATVVLHTKGLQAGDVAGLALLSRPYAWIAVERKGKTFSVTRFDEQQGRQTPVTVSVPLAAERVWLRTECDFLSERQTFSYSTDGATFEPLGGDFVTAFQLITFQGVRYALFAFNSAGGDGGFADFDSMQIHEPDPRGLKPIPYGSRIVFVSTLEGEPAHLLAAPIRLIDRGLGRVSLERTGEVLTVQPDGRVAFAAKSSSSPGQVFQWMETLSGEVVLMSLRTHRYLRVSSAAGLLLADSPGPTPDGKDGTRFWWRASR
jgi:xylan 1,4-beta-xylosidase